MLGGYTEHVVGRAGGGDGCAGQRGGGGGARGGSQEVGGRLTCLYIPFYLLIFYQYKQNLKIKVFHIGGFKVFFWCRRNDGK